MAGIPKIGTSTKGIASGAGSGIGATVGGAVTKVIGKIPGVGIASDILGFLGIDIGGFVGGAINTVGGWLGLNKAPWTKMTEAQQSAYVTELYKRAWTEPSVKPYDYIKSGISEVYGNPEKFMSLSGVLASAASYAQTYGHDWKTPNPAKSSPNNGGNGGGSNQGSKKDTGSGGNTLPSKPSSSNSMYYVGAVIIAISAFGYYLFKKFVK